MFRMFLIKILLLTVNLYGNSEELTRLENIGTGFMQSGEIKYVTAEFTNESVKDIYIRKVSTSCSCFKVYSESQNCKSGETLLIPVRIDSSSKSGHVSQILTVESDAGIYQGHMEGEVLTDIMSAPSTLFFEIPQTRGVEKVTNIWSNTESFEIKRIIYDESFFYINCEKLKPSEDHGEKYCSYQINIKIKDNLPYDPNDTQKILAKNIILETNSPNREHVLFEAYVKILEVPLVTFIPSHWILPLTKKEHQFLIILRNEQCQLDTIECDIPGVELKWARDENDKRNIIVEIETNLSLQNNKRKVYTGFVSLYCQNEKYQVPLMVLNDHE